MKCSRLPCTRIVDAARIKHGLCRKHWDVAPRSFRLVDAERTRQHLAQLRDLGWTYGAIWARTGISRSSLREIATVRRVRELTETAILSIPLTRHLSRHVLVDATGTRRRIEALAYLGWPLSHLEPRLGRCQGRVGKAIATGWVSTQIAAAVDRVYRELEGTPGPSDIARRRALRRGFVGPAAWDDRNIDDPCARPLAPYMRRVAA